MTIRRKLGLTLCVLAALSACSSAAERKVNYLKHAQTYYDQKNYDKAGVEVRNALQMDPKYVDARYLFARIAESKGDARAAAGQYLGLIDEHPGFAPAHAAMARMYLLGGLTDKAQELVDRGLQKSPGDAQLVMMRGALKAQRGDVQGAMDDALEAHRKDADNDLAISLMASLYKQQGRLDDAVKVVSEGLQKMPGNVDLHVIMADLENARQRYDAVEAQLKQVIELEPKVLAHRTRLVQFYQYRKEDTKAESVWRQAVKALPDAQEPKLALVGYLWRTQGEAAATGEMHGLLAAKDDQNLKLEWGSLLARNGKVDAAQQVFNEIIAAAGTKAAGLGARNRLAALLLSANKPDAAGALVADVLKENPRDNDALIMRANMAMAKGDAATAITDLRSVLRDQPNATALMRALARAHVQNNEMTLAEETLRNAVQSNPADIEARKELAQLYVNQQKTEQARSLYDELAKVPAVSDMLDVQESRFRIQMIQKDYKAAAVTVEDMQRVHGEVALPYYLAGLLAEAQNDRSAARARYEQALDKQPAATEPLTALVRLEVADKRIPQSLQRLDQMVATSPKHSVAWSLRGELLASQKQFAQAEESFRKAIELAPKWPAPYRGLALIQLAQGRVDAAIGSYRDAIGKTASESLSTELAALYERQGNSDAAIDVYQQWLRRDPKSLLAANNLAMMLLSYRQDAASVAEAARLAETLSGSSQPAMLDTRGWVKFKAGDAAGAVPLLEQAVRAAPQAGVLRYHLGMAQWKSGNVTAARDNLQAALKSGAQFVGSEEARQVLAQLKSAG